MTKVLLSRRKLLTAAGVAMATGVSSHLNPAFAQGLTPTKSMRGGSNNYHPDAPIVDRIGGRRMVIWLTTVMILKLYFCDL